MKLNDNKLKRNKIERRLRITKGHVDRQHNVNLTGTRCLIGK